MKLKADTGVQRNFFCKDGAYNVYKDSERRTNRWTPWRELFLGIDIFLKVSTNIFQKSFQWKFGSLQTEKA